MAEYISVSDLNSLAAQVLAQCEPLSALIVCGEISNFTRHYKSGHLYFTLKDDKASVKCVMFRDKARLLGFDAQNGMQVLVYGRATLYERDGAFQIYAEYMRPFGVGAAQMAFDALKKKLEAEGLFDQAHKRPLPAMPGCIGIVTSKTGAALQDVINVMGRRWPVAKLLLAPVSVQGFTAEQTIVDGIHALERDGRPELILVTRGGGSKEDLWVFNSERIARAAYQCRVPVVSAVGHEIDYTILDYVADLRAPTPSAAAELCVPSAAQILQKIFILGENIQKNMQARYQICYNSYNAMKTTASLQGISAAAAEKRRMFTTLCESVSAAANARADSAHTDLSRCAQLAASLNPYAVLARGYSMVTDDKGVPKAMQTIQAGEQIEVRGFNTAAHCTVDSVYALNANAHKENHEENRNESTKKL